MKLKTYISPGPPGDLLVAVGVDEEAPAAASPTVSPYLSSLNATETFSDFLRRLFTSATLPTPPSASTCTEHSTTSP